MLPCTKSYISISILKRMLTCRVCKKRVQNPHSFVDCDEHFFCLSCKGDGDQCPVCCKSLKNSKLTKEEFFESILRTSCFTTHDKDFEREKVPIHLVNKLFEEFEHIDNLYLDGFAAQNRLKSPMKQPRENGVLRSGSLSNTVQTKLNFLSQKKEKTLDDKTNLQGCAKILNDNAQKLSRSRTPRGRPPQNLKTENGSGKLNSVKRKSKDINLSPASNTPKKRRSLSEVACEEKLTSDGASDSQSIFLPQKSAKKSALKIVNESKKPAKNGLSENECDSEEGKLKSIPAIGSEKKQPKQSPDLNATKNESTNTNARRQSKDNNDKSILEKEKKTKNIFKKNAKGETALHIACRTNKLGQLKELLATDWKLHINDKDFAGWTPLHEAVTSGNYEIAKILLEAGAWVFVPGYNFETPLHTAMYKTEDFVKLIMSYKPDVEARTIYGQTPMSIAKELGLESLLEPFGRQVLDLPTPPSSHPTMVYVHDSSSLDKNLIASLRKLDVSVAKSFSKDASHVVVKTSDNNSCEPAMIVLEGILMGKFLLSSKWIEDSVENGLVLECEQYEVSGVGSHPGCHAPFKARLNTYRLFPGLFAGAFFYLVGNWRDSTKREKITSLIGLGEGTILKREPDPENIPESESTVMYHAKSDSVMAKCSHVLLYNEENDGPQIKYRMPHVKTLPLKWLITCIETFSIIDPE